MSALELLQALMDEGCNVVITAHNATPYHLSLLPGDNPQKVQFYNSEYAAGRFFCAESVLDEVTFKIFVSGRDNVSYFDKPEPVAVTEED